jgi:PPM family protein phosphatase
MTLSLRFAARSDVGLLREGNEDSGYAGPSLLAVADGMGGHAAGEVASSVAVATLAHLEDDVPGSGLLDTLAHAVTEANNAISHLVDENPRLDGMGTTLTALLWAGRRLGLVHVGDSRAYLLRDGELQQITHDHTFVQTLVDEGRITAEEAGQHPQRSLLMRALDGRGNPDPDLSVREVRLGDRYLLCSDGLSGVVPFETIAEALSISDPDAAVEKLVGLALEAGGPDNITCIVADVVESDTAPAEHPLVVGAAAERRRSKADATAEIDLGTAERGSGRRRRLGWLSRSLVLLLAVVLVGGAGWAAYAWSQRQYYVGADDGRVTIFRGLPQEIVGRSLSQPYERQDVLLSDLSTVTQTTVRETIFAGDIDEARKIVDRLREQAAECREARERARQVAPKPAATRAPTPPARAGAAAPPTARQTARPTTAPATPPTTAVAPPADNCGDPGA